MDGLREILPFELFRLAWKYLQKKDLSDAEEIETIRFENVHPLYGAIDVRHSTLERNRAAEKDLKHQLLALTETLIALKGLGDSAQIDNYISEAKSWLECN